MSVLKHLRYSDKSFFPFKQFWLEEINSCSEPFFFKQESGSSQEVHPPQAVVTFDILLKSFPFDGFAWHIETHLMGFFLSGLHIVLNRYTDSNCLIFHIPKSVGKGTETLPISVPNVMSSGKELLDFLCNKITRCRQYEEFPLDLLPESQKLDSNVLIGTVGRELPDMVGTYDLKFELDLAPDKVGVSIYYNASCFSVDFMHRMQKHLVTVFEVIFLPEHSTTRPDIFTVFERKQILEEFNQTAIDFGNQLSVSELFEAQVRRSPERTAIVYNNIPLTYAELNKNANNLANDLRNNFALACEDRIAILLEKSDLFIIAIMGILKAGAAYVPVDPNYPRERINFILADSGAKVVITLAENLLHLTNSGSDLYAIDVQLDESESQAANTPFPGSLSTLAYVIYTSGSTGTPKGVMIEHGHITNTLLWRQRFYCFSEHDKTLQLASIAFDSSVEDIFGMLISGGQLILPHEANKIDLEYLSGVFGANTISHLLVVPSLYKLVLAHLWPKMHALKAVTVAGEEISSDLVNIHYTKLSHVDLINEYGPTECSVCTTATVLRKGHRVTIGKPIDNTRIVILNKSLQLQPVGIVGELFVTGKGVGRGYHNRLALTAERFIEADFFGTPGERYYRTGDLGRWNQDGTIGFIGRADDQVKVRGIRIEPGEIEDILIGNQEVSDCCVMARKNAMEEIALCAYYIIRPGSSYGESELRDYLKAKLPALMVPEYFFQVNEFPLTPNGKLDKNALSIMATCSGRSSVRELPVSNVEKVLSQIWQETLGREDFGVTEDFFELGGHSLKGTLVIAQIHKRLNVKMAINDIFVHKTIRGMARLIEGGARTPEEVIPLVPIADSYELSHAQKRLWVVGLEGTQSTFNMLGAYEFTGNFRVSEFQRALQDTIIRHESLRTVFLEVNEEPRQRVIPADQFKFSLQVEDLRLVAQPAEEVNRCIASEYHFKFDLYAGPLVRARLLKVAEKRFFFLLNIHHIICDGWSLGIIIGEMTARYNQLTSGVPFDSKLLRIQYKDFAAYHNQLLSENRWEEARAFWKGHLQGTLAYSEFPIDFARSLSKTHNGKAAKFVLDQELTKRLRGVSAESEASLFMTLTAAFYVLLHHYSGNNDLVIGTPVAGRYRSELEDQVGLYLNTLPLRFSLDNNKTFSEIVWQVKAITLQAFEHQYYPLDEILSDLNLKRESWRSPLFETGITWQNHEVFGAVFPTDTQAVPLPLETLYVQHDIWFYGTEGKDTITFEAAYNSDLFLPQTVVKICECFIALLQEIVNLNRPIVEYLATMANDPAFAQQHADAKITEEF